MSEKRQGYYAALEREAKVKRQIEETDQPESEYLYTELGMKAYTAMGSLFDWLAGLSDRNVRASSISPELVNKAVQAITKLEERLTEIENDLKVVVSGMSRIDKFTLEAFRKLEGTIQKVGELSQRMDTIQPDGWKTSPSLDTNHLVPSHRSDLPKPAKRMNREDVRELAIATAREMLRQGKKVTLSSVARAAGLKYSQITYAFDSKQAFLDAVHRVDREAEAEEPVQAASTSDGSNQTPAVNADGPAMDSTASESDEVEGFASTGAN